MSVFLFSRHGIDHCRIGSLENASAKTLLFGWDHCRIGSLENLFTRLLYYGFDHCRIGSLEKNNHF
jgi:hypothetical protein